MRLYIINSKMRLTTSVYGIAILCCGGIIHVILQDMVVYVGFQNKATIGGNKKKYYPVYHHNKVSCTCSCTDIVCVAVGPLCEYRSSVEAENMCNSLLCQYEAVLTPPD